MPHVAKSGDPAGAEFKPWIPGRQILPDPLSFAIIQGPLARLQHVGKRQGRLAEEQRVVGDVITLVEPGNPGREVG